MDTRILLLSIICIAAVIIAGCTSGTGTAAPATQVPATQALATPAPVTTVLTAPPTATSAPETTATQIVQTTKVPTSPVRIWVTQQRYSPTMSSTPGLEMSVITGVDTATAEYDWTASYGYFVTWNPQSGIVNQVGPKITNNGGKVYWTFTDKPTSTASPVIITVNVREVAGKEIGQSVATLAWDGDNAVTVKEIA